jgi:hypothetical protein
MKARLLNRPPPPKKFIPLTMDITFESQEEIDKLYAIMNTPLILEGFDFTPKGQEIRRALEGEADYDSHMSFFQNFVAGYDKRCRP